MRSLPLRFHIGTPPRKSYVDSHRPKTISVRPLLPVVQAEAIAQTTLQPLPQSFLRTAATSGENAPVSRVRKTVQVSAINSRYHRCPPSLTRKPFPGFIPIRIRRIRRHPLILHLFSFSFNYFFIETKIFLSNIS